MHVLNFIFVSSVHCNYRLKKSNKMQQYADIYLLLNYSTCFGRTSSPSSGVHEIVVADSVHRNSRLKKSNKMQQYADIYLLLNYSTCFGRPSRPSSGIHKTLVAVSGTDHTIWGASFFKHDQIRTGWESRLSQPVLNWSRLEKLASQII